MANYCCCKWPMSGSFTFQLSKTITNFCTNKNGCTVYSKYIDDSMPPKVTKKIQTIKKPFSLSETWLDVLPRTAPLNLVFFAKWNSLKDDITTKSAQPLVPQEAKFLNLLGFDLGISKNRGSPKSSILIGFSIINHPFWGTPIFGNTHLLLKRLQLQQPMSPQQTQDSYHQLRIRTGEEMRAKIQVPGWLGCWFFSGMDLGCVGWRWWFTGWWFQLFFMFSPIWGRFQFWLIFLKGVETTNQFTWSGCLRFLRGNSQVFRGRINDWILVELKVIELKLSIYYGSKSPWKTTIWGICFCYFFQAS